MFAEELAAFVGGNPRAGVDNFRAEVWASKIHAHGDASTERRKFQGVAHKVGEQLIGVCGIAAGERQLVGACKNALLDGRRKRGDTLTVGTSTFNAHCTSSIAFMREVPNSCVTLTFWRALHSG